LRSIEDETAAYTASADMVGAVDEEKYAKQLAERAKYEAELAQMQREAQDREFNDAISLNNDKLKLAELQAESEIQNAQELEDKKKEIKLAALEEQLAITKKYFGELSDEERIQIDMLIAMIKKLKNEINNGGEDGDGKTLGESIGISDEGLEKATEILDAMSAGVKAVSDIVNGQYEIRLNNLDKQTQAEIAAVNASTQSEENKSEKIKQIEQKAAQEEWKIKKKQFEANKKISIVQAIIAGALGVVNAFQLGPIAGAIAAALIAATTAVQVGVIASSQPPPPPAFATGGKVKGAGTGTSDSIAARLSNGEAVINAKSTAMYEPVLSAINAAGGGVDWYNGEQKLAKGGIVQKFAAGGVAMSSNAIMRENEAAQQIQQTIIQTPPVLVLEEFQDVQGRQVRTETNLQL